MASLSHHNTEYFPFQGALSPDQLPPSDAQPSDMLPAGIKWGKAHRGVIVFNNS